ncbi:hypothetical protein LEP1GSC170_5252 [Leptospira interrogans serovar Bataviae str. HAI135]|nr:hypothetical protein LEP1GSC170_5252 [Leptospira interrogans serovar Bataviae str. HAI135]
MFYLSMNTDSGMKSYPEELEKEMFAVVEKELQFFVSKEKIHRLSSSKTESK